MVVVQESNERFHVTIPKNLAKAMGWGKGTELTFSVIDDTTLRVKEE